MTSLFVYIYCLFLFAQIITTKPQPGLEIIFETELCECFSDFLGLTNFLRLEETVDWSKLLKFGRTLTDKAQSKWIPRQESQQYSKLKQNNVDLRKNSNIPKLSSHIAKLSNTPERKTLLQTGKKYSITIKTILCNRLNCLFWAGSYKK